MSTFCFDHGQWSWHEPACIKSNILVYRKIQVYPVTKVGDWDSRPLTPLSLQWCRDQDLLDIAEISWSYNWICSPRNIDLKVFQASQNILSMSEGTTSCRLHVHGNVLAHQMTPAPRVLCTGLYRECRLLCLSPIIPGLDKNTGPDNG